MNSFLKIVVSLLPRFLPRGKFNLASQCPGSGARVSGLASMQIFRIARNSAEHPGYTGRQILPPPSTISRNHDVLLLLASAVPHAAWCVMGTVLLRLLLPARGVNLVLVYRIPTIFHSSRRTAMTPPSYKFFERKIQLATRQRMPRPGARQLVEPVWTLICSRAPIRSLRQL